MTGSSSALAVAGGVGRLAARAPALKRGSWRRWLLATALLVLQLGAVASDRSPQIDYARNFEIERHDSHRILRVRNTWTGSGEREQLYALVPRGDRLPQLPREAVVVRTPVERLVIMATVYLGPIQDLGLHEALVGIAYPEFVSDPEARSRLADGRIRAVQGSGVDIESLMMLRPDLILTSTTGSATFDTHPQMIRAGLPVALTADYMEEHPLARAEWIKFIAEFFDRGEDAEAVFGEVSRRYRELAALAAQTIDRPSALTNAPYGGVWHVPGGRSYTAQSIEDAGARYIWSRLDSRGGVPLDFEVILRDAADADYWLHPSHYQSLSQLLAADERFRAFKAVRDRRVYNNTVRVNPGGGNDIYERGVSHPEEVLADLIKIFHPELLPEHSFVYYEVLE